MRIGRFLLTAFALAGGLAVLGGCDDDPTDARLRAIHASIDAPAVDIYLAGDPTPLATNVSYGDASRYLSVPEGTYAIELRAAGDPATATPVYVSPSVDLVADERYTAVALGRFGGLTGAVSTFGVALYRERFGGSGPDNARARVIHGSPDAPIVAVDLGDDGTADLPGIAFGEDSGENGFNVPAGVAAQVAIRLTAPDERFTAFTTPELSSSRIYTIIATGYTALLPREEQGFQLLVVDDQANTAILRQNPTVFALHAGPDAPPVDISTGELLLVGDLAFGELSDAVQVPPGSYALDFRPTGDTGDPVASVSTPVLEAGERYLAVAAGFLLTAQPDFTVVPVGDAFTTGGDAPLVRVVHASSDTPPVDVGAVGEGGFTPVPDFVDLAFGDASPDAGTPLTAGPLTAGVSQTGLGIAIATFDLVLAPGDRLFAVAGGTLSGPGEPLRLFVVDTAVFPWTVAEVPANLPVD